MQAVDPEKTKPRKQFIGRTKVRSQEQSGHGSRVPEGLVYRELCEDGLLTSQPLG